MKLNEHERTRPNIAGLTSAVQQAEIKLLLAGRWPPLKPLPVFKFETDEYRAALDFDKLRGEWVCRKTSLPSNKVHELRGGLTEITTALPRGATEVFAECTAAEQPEQELEKDASRRREAMLAWRESCESGALYARLQDYLSESQQDEIDDSIRLTLTARQLQVCPKNVAYVFEALAKAGGKLSILIDIARQNKAEQEAGVPAKAKSATAGASASSGPLPSSGASGAQRLVSVEAIQPTLDRRVEGLTLAPVEGLVPATLESFPVEPIARVFPEQEQRCLPGWTAHAASPAWKTVTPEILDADARSFAKEFQEKVRRHEAVTRLGASFGRQGRTGKVEPSADGVENLRARLRVLEISGWQVAAAALLVALASLAVVLTVGHGLIGKRLFESPNSVPAVKGMSPAPLDGPGETGSRSFTPSAENTSLTPEVNPPAPATAGPPAQIPAAQYLNARPEESTTRAEPIEPSSASSAITTRPLTNSHNAEVSAEDKDANEAIARNGPAPANAPPGHSPRTAGAIGGAAANPVPRLAPATRVAPHLSSPSTILVSGPGDGSKPFRLTLPEQPIAASSAFAMTSQLSVLVSPEPGLGPAHKPARLDAGELVSFVWPRYPKPGERHGSAETVRVRTTIGEFGQVLDVKRVSGSTALLPAAMSAIRQWRYKPTLLNRRPVQAQQDVTIEFRAAQRLPRVRAGRSAPDSWR
jgi:protein TonB